MTENQQQARALHESGDTRDGYLAKLKAAKISHDVEVLRVLGAFQRGRAVSSHVSVFVQGDTVASFVEPDAVGS